MLTRTAIIRSRDGVLIMANDLSKTLAFPVIFSQNMRFKISAKEPSCHYSNKKTSRPTICEWSKKGEIMTAATIKNIIIITITGNNKHKKLPL